MFLHISTKTQNDYIFLWELLMFTENSKYLCIALMNKTQNLYVV